LSVLLAGTAPAAAPAARKGARDRCQVTVRNKTPFRALVHFDGVYWGWVNAARTFTFKGVPRGNVIAYASTQYGEQFWGPKALKCDSAATWDLAF
jgi:hypothetical protein